MSFANPKMLWLLAVFPPLLLVFFWWAWRKRQQLITQFIQARLLPGLTVGISATRLRFRLAFLILAVTCLIVALARPRWGFDWEPAKQRGLDIIVAIDTSKSMLAEDIAPNRLTRAKLAALDLMQQARADRLGLIAFAGGAFLQCPLTVDDAVFRQSVEALDVNIIPTGGTALAEAIEKAMVAFSEADTYKALVLITDGEDHDSAAVEAAKRAATAGLQIFTVGVGTADGELLRIKDANGRQDYVRDEDGNVVKSHLNEQLLKDIAQETERGVYVRLQGAKSIEMLYAQALSKLPKSEHEEKLIRRYHERYHWPLAIALLLLTAEMLFPERRREPKSRLVMATGTAALKATASLWIIVALPSLAHGSTASALREYKDGKYSEAFKQYQKLLESRGDDPRLHFNAGTAAYREKNFEQAVKEFDNALSAPDLKLQGLSYYNRGNARFWQGEQNQDPAKKTESWTGALKDFESSLKMNPQDADAKFNYQFVKKKLEELKQQQQQQQKSDQNKNEDQDKDKQQQQDQQQKNQDSQKDQKEEEKKQSQQEQSQQQKDQQKQQDQQAQKDQQQEKNQQADQKKEPEQEKKKKEQAASKPSEQEKKEAQEKENEAAMAAGQMTPEQARQLLDAQKGDEQLLHIKPEKKPTDRSRLFKDW